MGDAVGAEELLVRSRVPARQMWVTDDRDTGGRQDDWRRPALDTMVAAAKRGVTAGPDGGRRRGRTWLERQPA
jgi:hypothetical protein